MLLTYILLVEVGEWAKDAGGEEVAVGDVDVGVEPPVERGLGDEVEEREEDLRQDHQSMRRVPHHHQSHYIVSHSSVCVSLSTKTESV